MARKLPIMDEYQTCEPMVPQDLGSLKLLYTAHKDASCDLQKLTRAMDACLREFKSNHQLDIHYRSSAVHAKDGHNRIYFRVFCKDKDGKKVLLKSSELKTLTYALSGNGLVTPDASKYIRDCCEGTIVPPAPPPPPAPVAAPPTPSPAPSPQIMGPAIVPTVVQPVWRNGVPLIPHQGAVPILANNILRLHYTLNGPVNSAMVVNDYSTLKSRIEQAIRLMPNRPDTSEIKVYVGAASSTTNPQGGFSDAVFTVGFSRKLGATTLNLQAADMLDIAYGLQAYGCLSQKDAGTLCTQIVRAVSQPGWSHTP